MMVKKFTLGHSNYEDWLYCAEDDINLSFIACEISPRNASYLAQQGAEKALKAFLIFMKTPLRRTHDLTDLLESCAEFDNEFRELYEIAEWLQPFSTKARYPDSGLYVPDTTTVQLLAKDAQRILSFVQKKIFELK